MNWARKRSQRKRIITRSVGSRPGVHTCLHALGNWAVYCREFCGRKFYSLFDLSKGIRHEESQHLKTAVKIARAGGLKQFVLGKSLGVHFYTFPQAEKQKLDTDARQDGMLKGIKAFRWLCIATTANWYGRAIDSLYRDYLVSPTTWAVWESHVLKVPKWHEANVVRGVAGIHAAWPTLSGRLPAEIAFWYYNTRDTSHIIAEVLGWGRVATGNLGWRAENVMIKKVYAQLPEQVAKIQERYPEIEVVHRSQWGRE